MFVFVAAFFVAALARNIIANAVNGWWLRRGTVLQTGHYIRIEGRDDVEGYVAHIGLRYTQLETPAGDVARIPNTTLANSIFTNFHLASAPDAILVDLDADAMADSREVAETISQEADALARANPGIAGGSLRIRTLPGRFPGCRRYVLQCRAQNPVSRNLVRDELERRVRSRLHRDGIAVPLLPSEPKKEKP
ncbi:MAG: mechanosensitive ion channel domain-containing protein [Thermoplasmatota archaeon]